MARRLCQADHGHDCQKLMQLEGNRWYLLTRIIGSPKPIVKSNECLTVDFLKGCISDSSSQKKPRSYGEPKKKRTIIGTPAARNKNKNAWKLKNYEVQNYLIKLSHNVQTSLNRLLEVSDKRSLFTHAKIKSESSYSGKQSYKAAAERSCEIQLPGWKVNGEKISRILKFLFKPGREINFLWFNCQHSNKRISRLTTHLESMRALV